MKRILLAILTDKTRLPSALYTVKSSPRDLPVIRNTETMEKSCGNPPGKTVAVGIEMTDFFVSL